MLPTAGGPGPYVVRTYGLKEVFLEIWDSQGFLLGDSSLLSHVGFYYAFLFVSNYIFPVRFLQCFYFLGESHIPQSSR